MGALAEVKQARALLDSATYRGRLYGHLSPEELRGVDEALTTIQGLD